MRWRNRKTGETGDFPISGAIERHIYDEVRDEMAHRMIWGTRREDCASCALGKHDE